MDLIDLQAVGMPMITIGRLHRMQQEELLGSMTLPEFISLWICDERMRQRPDGKHYVEYGDFVQMQAMVADIGGTIGGTSRAGNSELMQLSPVPNVDPDLQERLWEAACNSAAAIVEAHRTQQPKSIHQMFSATTYATSRDFSPRFAGATTISEISQTEMPIEEIGRKLQASAYNAFTVGLAIAMQHSDFYNEMEKLHQPSSSNGLQLPAGNGGVLSTQLKREYQLALCRIWASLCRPDLAHLLDSA